MPKDEALEAVHNLFSRYDKNYKQLIDKNEISFATDYEEQFSKVLLLACASYFETKIIHTIFDILQKDTANPDLISNFILNKALSRKYHTLFNWQDKNANTFFGLFGDNFKEFMKNEIKNNPELSESIKDFLELGRLRNELVHNNYALFNLPLTINEIKAKFNSSQKFPLKIQELSIQYHHKYNNVT